MPEQIRCPSCDAALRVPESLLGKTVKCPKCQKTFLAETEEPAEPEGIVREPAPSAARRRPKPPEDVEDEEELPPDEEFEEEEERPRRRKRRRRYAEAQAVVAGPAISLIIIGSLNLMIIVVLLVLRMLGLGFMAAGAGAGGRLGPADAQAVGFMIGNIIGTILALCFAGTILFGGVKMRKLEGYGLAMTACILSILPCGNCLCFSLVPIGIGIWGLVVLNRPEVKDAFS
jgi:predicted Zn finger-like uncharacterized protein